MADLADQMDKVTVADSSPQQKETPEVALEYSLVLSRLKRFKNSGPKLLQETAEVVKAFLMQNKENAGMLMDAREFLPFLENCLKNKASSPALLSSVCEIIQRILTEAKNSGIPKLDRAQLIPLLVDCLEMRDSGILEKVVKTLGLLASHPKTCHVFQAEPIWSSVIKALTKKLIMKGSTPPSEKLTEYLATLLGGLMGAESMTNWEQEDEEDATVANQQPTLPPPWPVVKLVKPMLPLLSRLYDIGNDKAKEVVLRCLRVSLGVIKDLQPFIKNGLAVKLVSFLESSSQNQIMETALALGNVGLKGSKEVLKFLKAVRGTEGLKHYWKCVQFDEDYFRKHLKIYQDLSPFWNSVNILFLPNPLQCSEVSTAVIESGYAHALARCLSSHCPEMFKIVAVSTLGGVYKNPLSSSSNSVILEFDILPKIVEYLKSSDNLILANASLVLCRLMYGNPQRRDRALELGAMSILLENLVKHYSNAAIVHEAMLAVESLLSVRPSPPLEMFKRVLETITSFLHAVDDDPDRPHISGMTISIFCISNFTGYGLLGIDAILEVPQLDQKIVEYIQSSVDPLNAAAVVLLAQIVQVGNSQHRRRFLDMGVLQMFKGVMEWGGTFVRKAVICSLHCFLNEELTPVEMQTVKDLRHLILLEVSKRNAETYEVARTAYLEIIRS